MQQSIVYLLDLHEEKCIPLLLFSYHHRHPLMLADGSGFKHNISLHTGKHNVQLLLPPMLVCYHCVLQVSALYLL